MVHVCAARHVSNADTLMRYVSCMMEDNYDPMAAGRKCAIQVGAGDEAWRAVERCVSGEEGGDLMAAIGDDTHSLRPKVSFIPTVQLNGSQDGQKDILKDFLKEVCRKYKVSSALQCCS